MKSTEETAAIIVPADCAQKIRSELEKMNFWDSTYRLKKLGDTGQVAIPIDINRGNITEITDCWPDFRVDWLHLPFSKKLKIQHSSPITVLQNEIQHLLETYGLAENLLLEVPSKWERHDDLIIIPAHAFSSSEWNMIGESLWETVAKCLSCKRLARHSTVASDGFRSSQVVMLLGEDDTVTHVDNGIKYTYNVTKCMFSSGNITEKLRVAGLDCSSETVVDLYAGIGYFTLPFLVHAKACHVHACEWNPNAVSALKHNLLSNHVSERCTVHAGDNRLFQLSSVADRVNLGLIPSSEEGWPIAIQVLKRQGGILHVHGCVTVHRRKLEVNAEDHFHDMKPGKQQQTEPAAEVHVEDVHGFCESDLGTSDPRHLGKTSVLKNSGIDNSEDSLDDTHAKDNLEVGYMISQPRSCDYKDVKFEAEEHFQCNYDVTPVAGTTGDHDHQQNQSNLTEKIMTAKSCESDRNSRKYSGRENTLMACQEWSVHVRRKIRSMLEEKKGGIWSVEVLHIEIVKSYAPHIVHAVLDLECRPGT